MRSNKTQRSTALTIAERHRLLRSHRGQVANSISHTSSEPMEARRSILWSLRLSSFPPPQCASFARIFLIATVIELPQRGAPTATQRSAIGPSGAGRWRRGVAPTRIRGGREREPELRWKLAAAGEGDSTPIVWVISVSRGLCFRLTSNAYDNAPGSPRQCWCNHPHRFRDGRESESMGKCVVANCPRAFPQGR